MVFHILSVKCIQFYKPNKQNVLVRSSAVQLMEYTVKLPLPDGLEPAGVVGAVTDGTAGRGGRGGGVLLFSSPAPTSAQGKTKPKQIYQRPRSEMLTKGQFLCRAQTEKCLLIPE